MTTEKSEKLLIFQCLGKFVPDQLNKKYEGGMLNIIFFFKNTRKNFESPPSPLLENIMKV